MSMMPEDLDNFIAITDCRDSQLAQRFLEMGNGDLNTAISLYYEHGVSHNNPTTTTSGGGGDNDNAESSRNEQEGSVRPPMEFRQEVLTQSGGPTTGLLYGSGGSIGGSFQPLRHVQDMFDTSRPVGVFNQRLDDDYDYDYDCDYDTFSVNSSSSNLSENNSESSDDENNNHNNVSENDDEYEYVEEPVVEIDEDGNIQESFQLVKKLKTYSKEERLARLFRPPFEIMAKLTLDGARAKGRRPGKMKWIMINIQDNGIFQCQALNRDVWSSKRIRKIIKRRFIFLQYQFESRMAQQYLNYYNLHDKELLPHIAILDPMTGERVKQWNTYLPTEEQFLSELNRFLNEFSLDPAASNPIVKEPTPELDPTMMTEEQQMDIAIRQSLNIGTHSNENPSIENIDPSDDSIVESINDTDPFDSIKPIEHKELENQPGMTTRIQIRTGDGKRFIRRFNSKSDTVRTIYEVIKTEMSGYETCHFILSDHRRNNLIEKLDQSIEEAGLNNSNLLLESSNDNEE